MNTKHLAKASATCAALCVAVAAHAQTDGTFLLTSSNTVSPTAPSTTIEIWATWDDPAKLYMFGGADYDIIADGGVFSDPVNILNGPISSAGVPSGNTIVGGTNGQLWLPIGCGWGGCDDNPILLAAYTWTATDFTPRSVDLITSNTTKFIVGAIATGNTTQLFPHEFTPGSGVITVVPGPGVAAFVVLPIAALGSRRRAVGS